MSEAKIDLKIMGVRGENPLWHCNTGYCSIHVDNPADYISVDAFQGITEDYHRRGKSKVLVCEVGGSTIFEGTLKSYVTN